MRKNSVKIILISCMLFVSFIMPQALLAQTLPQEQANTEMTIDDGTVKLMAIPPRTENIMLDPGETYQFTVKLRNVSSRSQTVSTELQDFVIGEDGSTPVPISETEAAPLRWSLRSWMTVAPSQTTIKPNETALFYVVIQVPEDALAGGHFAMVLHHPTEGNKQGTLENAISQTNGSSSAVNPRVGSLVYVTVSGDIQESAFIRNFSVPTWVEYGPVEFSFDIDNQSDIHIAPQTKIDITNFFGRRIETVIVESKNIFPYSQRHFTAEVEKIWGFGPYRAHLVSAYGNTGKMVTQTLTFWMIPYKLILAALVVLSALLAIIIVMKRHLEHRSNPKTQRIEVLEERIKELEKEVKRKG